MDEATNPRERAAEVDVEPRARVYGIFATLLLRALTEAEQPQVVEMLGHVAEAVGRSLETGQLVRADVRSEFQQLFLIPLPARDVSLYGSAYRGDNSQAWGDVSLTLAALANACGVTWQTGEYGPDRAYLIDPDHLGLMLTLLAEVIERKYQGQAAPLADRPPDEWAAWLRSDLLQWVPTLAQRVAAQDWAVFYPEVLDLLLRYLALDDEMEKAAGNS